MRLKSRLRIFKTARTLEACARHAATAVPSASSARVALRARRQEAPRAGDAPRGAAAAAARRRSAASARAPSTEVVLASYGGHDRCRGVQAPLFCFPHLQYVELQRRHGAS